MDVWLFRPPVLVGERIVWLGSGSGLPQCGIVRWIGRLPEMGPDWTVGVELDNPLPYGGIDGTWGNRHLFTCEPKHGLLVPMSKTIKESELLKLSKENLENNLQYGRGANELFTKVHSGPPSSSSRPQVFPTPVARVNKLVTSEGTPEEPRPAIRRKRQHQVFLAAQQPKPPKRKVKCAVTSLLPKIYESNKENSRSLSSLNDFNTLKSTSTAFHTLTSSANDLSTLKTALDGFSTLRSSLNDYGTLKTCTSGDYSDYQWFDAKDDKSDLIDCRNILYEPVNKSALKQCHVIEGQQIRIIQENSCKRIEVKASSHDDVQIESMSEFSVKARCDIQDDDSSYEDAATTVDGIYPDQNSATRPNSDTNTNSSSRREKTASGFFSFLRWFRKGKDGDGDEYEDTRNGEFAGALTALSVPSSPVFIHSTSSSCGSIDTLFSTATVNSFAFVTPTSYRPFGSALHPEKRIAVAPDTDTYRNRLRQRDHIRELDKNLTLKKKYRLFGSETTLKSGVLTPEPSPIIERKIIEKNNENNQDAVAQTSSPGSRNSTFGRKKRKAPDPPDQPNSKFSDNSLPNSLEKCGSNNNNMDNGEPTPVRKTRHRRTVSESAKDKKAGAYCHVKGKRKAPQPPNQSGNSEPGPSTLEKVRNQFSSLGRKKRPAPQPPETSNKKKSEVTQSYQERSKSTVSQLSQEEKDRLIANIAKLKAHADRKSMNLQRHSQNMDFNLRTTQEHIVCNDSLKLERGVLKPNKEIAKADINVPETKAAPVSPRPWYKRSLTNKEGLSGLKRDIFKSLEKKKDREKEKEDEWMPEVGIPRVVTASLPSDGTSTSSRFNIFSRLERSDDKKAEKRKSQVSMLANISELDREAAEIVQKEQAREQALMAAQDAKFYSYPEVPITLDANFRDETNENVEVPKRSSARELISLFNAIGNVTKVTVNSTFFSKEGSGFFSKEGVEKRFSFMGESVRTEQRVLISDNKYKQQETMESKQSFVINSKDVEASSTRGFKAMSTEDLKHPQASGSQQGSSSSGITIEEVVEEDLEKSTRSRAMYEANKSRRHHSPSPSIPTIAEQSESASSVATTPASTLDPHPGSNRDSMLSDTAAPSAEIAVSDNAPDVLQQAKKVTIWTCPRCTLENPRWKITCDACGKWRPSITEEKSYMTKCDEPFQRPTSPLHDTKKPVTNKVQVIKMELTKKGTGINWEEEIKRYLPQNDKKSVKKDKSPEQSGEKSEIKSTDIVNSAAVGKPTDDFPKKENLQSNNGSGKIKTDLKNQPTTFIGGRLKQDKEKETDKAKELNLKDKNSMLVNGAGLVTEEPDVDEVRKARLAFFKRSTENDADIVNGNSILLTSTKKEVNDNSAVTIDTGTKKQPDEKEQLKLREMLKEMKNSLPKRSKQAIVTVDSKITSILKENEAVQTSDNSVGSNVDGSSRKLGAIKKVPQKILKSETKGVNSISSPSTERKNLQGDHKTKLQNGDVSDDNKAEAIFITKKTIYEDIKVKKTTGSKPLKVSTSVQTSSVMRKVDSVTADQEENTKSSEGKPPSGKYSDILPVTVEEFSNTGIKDGVLYTSLNKESRRIGTGTFELIRAKDFASIEATKTNVGTETSVVHVYANVPSSPSAVPKQKSSSQNNSSPRSVVQCALPSQQSTTPSGSSQASETPADKIIKPPEEAQTSQKENKTVQVAQNVEKKSTSSCEESSRGVTSTDSAAAQRSSRATSEASSYSVPSVSSGDYSEVERLTAQLTLPKGIADFKADLQATSPEQNMNTLAINRLLRRLEAAIAGGQHNQAAVLAKDLARLKISCSVIRQRRSLDASPASIMVEMYVEDKVSHQGPIPLQVVPSMTVAQLKQKVQQEFEIPMRVQRWILGKMLASDDAKTLQDHNVSSNGCPMFLYLVAPDGEQEGEPSGTSGTGTETPNVAESTQSVLPTPPPQPDHSGGWYYNNEEDRYSFCEDTESELTEEEDDEEEDNPSRKPIPLKDDNRSAVVGVEKKQDTAVRPKIEQDEEEEEEEEEEDDDGNDDDEEEDGGDGMVGASAVVVHEKPVVLEAPVVGRPFVKQSPQFPKSSVGLQTVETSSSNVQRSITPQSPKPAIEKEIIKTDTSEIEQLAKPGPSGHIMRQREEEKKPIEQKTGTLQLGWKCPLCTLVNSPTRPGCAACTTERPINYVVPVEYRANKQELQRMKNEQQVDNDLQQANAAEKQQKKQDQHQHYLQLVNLDKTDLVPSVEPFECSVCFVQYNAGEGVVLRECLHVFCRGCLAFAVQYNEEAEVKCPYRDADYACNSVLQEREIKALVPADVYEQHLAKSVAQAENKIGNAFHCKTPDCRGWCIFEDNVNEFKCPVCSKTNCLTCQAIHDGLNCKQYQERVKQASETDAEARRTKEMLEEMVVRGEAMNCPTCQVILMKKWGCDWLRCSMCKTEICWVTRGPRWGPGGKGDTTGGCQCGVNGIKCHPRCNYCH